MQRPINDWCSDADLPPCPPGETPGPAVAEGWDDWGPFYTPMYLQHVGVNSSTVEMCSSTTVRSCGTNANSRGRLGARTAQELVFWSTLAFDIPNRHDLLNDELEIYRRGVTNAPRPDCCDLPFGPENNWMLGYPQAYVIPLGEGQRSDPEANRLVQWLLLNGIEVEALKKDTTVGSRRFPSGSYVVFMDQPHRGLADTALGIGVDVTPRINVLYAPPGAWSHGYLWGADVAPIPAGPDFDPRAERISRPASIAGGLEAGAADFYVLAIDSPTAVRALNALTGAGVAGQLALSSFQGASGATLPAGSVIFDAADAAALAASGQANGLTFRAVAADAVPSTDPVAGTPRVAVLANAVNQEAWSLRDLGFTANAVPTGASSDLNNPSAPNPLDNYDVVFNIANWPSGTTARARLTAFFDAGGGYIGAGTGGASFLRNSGQFTGLFTRSQGGDGQSGIFYWTNVGGADSLVVGSYPSRDTLIMDPPTWFSAVPAGPTVDATLFGDSTGTFAAGLWREPRAAPPNAPIILHGASTAAGSTARITAFAANPLYRADPEREWPMVGAAAYWSDQ
jgi:hypothetical protein